MNFIKRILPSILAILVIIIVVLFLNPDYTSSSAMKNVYASEELALVAPDHIISFTRHTDPVFNRIAYCESENNPTAQNPSSTASGRFQFLDSSWKYYGKKLWGDEWVLRDKLDFADSTELAWYVYTKVDGTRPWEADPKSEACWNKGNDRKRV